MLWPARFTLCNLKRTRALLALALIAAAACDERVATGPQHAATQRASTDINPVPPTRSLSVSPSQLAYGPQAVGTSSAPQVVTVRNTGTDMVTLGILGGSPFPQTNNCPATLAPNQFCSISIVFAPTVAGPWAGLVMVTSNAPTSPDVVSLYGTGFVATPAISVTPSSIGFGSVRLGLATSGRTITVTSTGNAPLSVASVSLGGANPGDFWLGNDGCSGVALVPGASCTVAVSFEPLGVGTRTATVTIVHNAAGGSTGVSVGGTGVKSGGYIP